MDNALLLPLVGLVSALIGALIGGMFALLGVLIAELSGWARHKRELDLRQETEKRAYRELQESQRELFRADQRAALLAPSDLGEVDFPEIPLGAPEGIEPFEKARGVAIEKLRQAMRKDLGIK